MLFYDFLWLKCCPNLLNLLTGLFNLNFFLMSILIFRLVLNVSKFPVLLNPFPKNIFIKTNDINFIPSVFWHLRKYTVWCVFRIRYWITRRNYMENGMCFGEYRSTLIHLLLSSKLCEYIKFCLRDHANVRRLLINI